MTDTAPIYLDHNATSPPLPSVIEAVARAQGEVFGNPGSRHRFGRQARVQLEAARDTIAEVLGAQPDEVIFTSGGTEANNLAIAGLARGTVRTAVVTPGAHPSLLEPIRSLSLRGWSLHTLALDEHGQLQPDSLSTFPPAGLIGAMYAHNETGVVLDTTLLTGLRERTGCAIHFDAVQAAGRIPIDFANLPCNTLSVAAHKFHGPRGIGALLVRRGCTLPPLVQGGYQEKGVRPGTEVTALAIGMATALREYARSPEQRHQELSALRDTLQQQLEARCEPVVVFGAHTRRLPNTLNIAFPGCDGEALLVACDLAGVACSLGTTCASGSAEPAAILLAMGVPLELARSTIRLSVGMTNTLAEMTQAAERITGIVQRLRGVTND